MSVSALNRDLQKRGGISRGSEWSVTPCFADWLLRVAYNDARGLAKHYGTERTKAAMSETPSGAFGGYLVPVELRYDLMTDMAEESIFRRLGATVLPMASSTLQLPLPDAQTVQAAGTSPFFGGIKMTWTPEAATRTETEPTFRQLELHAWDLSGFAYLSKNLLDDTGAALEAYLRQLFARELAWGEDYAFFNGDGTGKPLGILPNPGTVSVTRATATNFKPIDADKMLGRLLPSSYARSVWAMHPTVLAQLETNFAGWIPNGPLILHGRPIIPTELLPVLGTTGDVTLFDPSRYIIGDRQAVEIESSDTPGWANNQMAWRILARLDGQPQVSLPITLQNASTTVSPYVVLGPP